MVFDEIVNNPEKKKGGKKTCMSAFAYAGINLARMLGDKFLKEQDERFSSEPYVSPVVHISKACTAFAVIARYTLG